MKSDRTAALNDLVTLSRPLPDVLGDLRVFGWDSADLLVTLTPSHIASVLNRFLCTELDGSVVENWANAIEGRDDIDYSTPQGVPLAIYELANPLLTQPLTRQSAQQLVARLLA